MLSLVPEVDDAVVHDCLASISPCLKAQKPTQAPTTMDFTCQRFAIMPNVLKCRRPVSEAIASCRKGGARARGDGAGPVDAAAPAPAFLGPRVPRPRPAV